MCWSATADLVAGAGVAAAGVACVAQVRDRRDLPLAALPLLFNRSFKRFINTEPAPQAPEDSGVPEPMPLPAPETEGTL